MFVDEIEFRVRGGKGGDGCVSFHREKFITRGGPDGGDGGAGGDVVFRTSPHENTLYHLVGQPTFQARNGHPGGGSNMTGRSAEDLVLDVPVGTVVLDAERGHVLRDLKTPGDEFVVVRGGKGGKGTKRLARWSPGLGRCENGVEEHSEEEEGGGPAATLLLGATEDDLADGRLANLVRA
jgi:GTP-binding protein